MIKARRQKAIAGRTARARAAKVSTSSLVGSDICVGALVAWDARGPLVDYPGNEGEPVRARVSTPSPGFATDGTALVGHSIVLLVDGRAGQAPVLLGFLTPAPAALATHDLEARVDGRRVELNGRDEIVLRCGDASITLRRNGRISIRGVDVETRAAGVNRIKGGTVNIN